LEKERAVTEIENLWRLIDEHVIPTDADELALSDALGCVTVFISF